MSLSSHHSSFVTRTTALLLAVSSAYSMAQIRIGGPNLKTANVHVDRGNLLKGASTVAIGAFRVIFVTSDSTTASGTNNFGGEGTAGQSAKAGTAVRLVGLDKPLMQKLTDEIYADFLAKGKAAGYTFVDSQALAAKSPTYKAMPMTENFSGGRFGQYVVPSGQMSVEQANDESKAVGRGASSGVFGGFKKQAQAGKKSDSDKAMPDVSKEAGDVPVWGVTMVVSFARFKSSGFSHWGQGAKTSVEVGPTINGVDEEDMPMATGVQFWTKDSNKQCIGCNKLPAASLRSDIHTTDHIGEMGKPVKKRNSSAMSFTGDSSSTSKADVGIDEEDYEKNEFAQASKASEMLLAALAKER